MVIGAAGVSDALYASGRQLEFATCVSYSEWELNSLLGRLVLEPFRGILDDSLSSDGSQKSDGIREAEGRKPVLGRKRGQTRQIRPLVCEGADSPGYAHRRQNEREDALFRERLKT